MARYDYMNDAGEVVEQSYPLTDNLPQTLEIDGETYRLVITKPAAVHYNCFGFYTTDNLPSIEKWRKENLKKGD